MPARRLHWLSGLCFRGFFIYPHLNQVDLPSPEPGGSTLTWTRWIYPHLNQVDLSSPEPGGSTLTITNHNTPGQARSTCSRCGRLWSHSQEYGRYTNNMWQDCLHYTTVRSTTHVSTTLWLYEECLHEKNTLYFIPQPVDLMISSWGPVWPRSDHTRGVDSCTMQKWRTTKPSGRY